MGVTKETNVFDLIERMSALIRSEERKTGSELGLQSVHLQVLDYLSRCNRYSDTPAALTNYLGMTRGTVSQTVLLLEKKGLIKKNIDLIDRRKLHLTLLDEGWAVLEASRSNDLFTRANVLLETDCSDYEQCFLNALKALQKAHKGQSFGQCKTCSYFKQSVLGFSCGLTKEPLSVSDSEKICQEHHVR